MTLKEMRSRIKSALKRKGMQDYYLDTEIDDRINDSIKELTDVVGGFSGMASGTTTSGTERYELPSELVSLERIEYDGEIISRVYADAIQEFEVPTSGSITWTVSNSTGLSATGVASTSDIGTFTDGDATPSVESYYYFETNNSTSTSITRFDDAPSSGGKEITIFVNDNNTTFVHNASYLNLSGDTDLSCNTGDVIRFFIRNGVAYESGRVLT